MIHRRKLLLRGSAFAAWAPAIVRTSSLLLDLTATEVGAQGAGNIYPTGPSLILKPGREFAANSWVHTRLADNAPLDPMSAAWVAEFKRTVMANQAGVIYMFNEQPIYIVGPDQPTSRVIANNPTPPKTTPNATYLQSRYEAIPIPDPDTFKSQPASDGEATIYQPSTGKLWEFWVMKKTGRKTVDSLGRSVDEWQADWGGRMDDIATNPGWWITETNFPHYPGRRFPPGMCACGIPMLAFCVSLADILAGEIRHPIGITIPHVDMGGPDWNRPPAQRTDGFNPLPNKIREGTIFRLPIDLNLDAYPLLRLLPNGKKTVWRMMAEAVQHYGMVVFDRGGTSILFSEKCNTSQYFPNDPYAPLRDSGQYFDYLRFNEFPWDKMRVLKTNLVSS